MAARQKLLSDKLHRVSEKQQPKISNIFLTMAIIYEFQGDWKEYIRRQAKQAIGTRKQFCEIWLTKQTKDLEIAINAFFEHYEAQ